MDVGLSFARPPSRRPAEVAAAGLSATAIISGLHEDPLPAGTLLGPYQIESSLGAGGMGEVYKARDTRLDRTVAIKVLPELFATDPTFRARFDREARAISVKSAKPC